MSLSGSYTQTDHTAERRVAIAGAGRVGRRTAKHLSDHGHDVYIIERDSKTVDTVVNNCSGVVIEGDAEDPQVLHQVEPRRVDVVAALTGDATTNFAICAEMQHLTEDVRTVARVNNLERVNTTNEFINEIVYPERIGSKAAVNRIQGESVQTIEDTTGDVDILNIRIHPRSPAAGEQVEDIRLPDGCHVISGADGTKIAGPETTLKGSRRYLIAVEPHMIDDVRKLLIG